MNKIRLYNIDCMKFMKRCNDNQFSLSICDPPYGLGNISLGLKTINKVYKKPMTWNMQIPGPEYFNELYRISKNQIIWGANYYGKFIKDVGRIVHDKQRDHTKNWKIKFSDCDIASQSFNPRIQKFEYQWCGNLQNGKINFDNTGPDARIHPTQKPIALYRWLLKNYAKKGDTIIDTHLGSFSSALAAYDMDFDFTGCEIDKDYFNAGLKRFNQFKAQTKMSYK